DSETLGGLVIETSGDLPEVGDRVDVALPDTDVLEEFSPERVLRTKVQRVERRVPAQLHVVVEEVVRWPAPPPYSWPPRSSPASWATRWSCWSRPSFSSRRRPASWPSSSR